MRGRAEIKDASRRQTSRNIHEQGLGWGFERVTTLSSRALRLPGGIASTARPRGNATPRVMTLPRPGEPGRPVRPDLAALGRFSVPRRQKRRRTAEADLWFGFPSTLTPLLSGRPAITGGLFALETPPCP